MRFKSLLMMVLWPLDRGLALLAWVGVLAYRRWISPRKGFRCAVSALTGQPSCSDVALEAFRTGTLSQSVPIIRTQFAKCRQTYAEHSDDLLNSANAYLSQLGVLAVVGAVNCCPPNGGGGGNTDGSKKDSTTTPVHIIHQDDKSKGAGDSNTGTSSTSKGTGDPNTGTSKKTGKSKSRQGIDNIIVDD